MPEATLPHGAKELYLSREASKRAVADPLPGPLAHAFGPQFIAVDKYRIRPLVAYDWAVMKILNSPVYRQMLELMQDGEKAKMVDPEPQEVWELIYLLTRPCAEADEVLQKGRDAFSYAAKTEFGFTKHLGQINRLNEACMQQIKAHMETMVKYAQEQEDSGAKDSPLAPLPEPPQSKQTDSGGG